MNDSALLYLENWKYNKSIESGFDLLKIGKFLVIDYNL